jgi:hypothetical protein
VDVGIFARTHMQTTVVTLDQVVVQQSKIWLGRYHVPTDSSQVYKLRIYAGMPVVITYDDLGCIHSIEHSATGY